MTTPKVVVLGLDGGTLDLVEPWTEAGLLPNLAAIMARGSRGTLRSTAPATTPLAWPTIFTGTNPGKHGIFGFHKRDPETYGWLKASALDLERPSLWEMLGEQGLRSGVFFMPYTFPAKPFDGCLLAGRGAPRRVESRVSHPDDLASKLAAEFGEQALFGPRRSREQAIKEVADQLVNGISKQTDAMIWTIRNQGGFDFIFSVWDHSDTAAHLFWHHSQPVPDADSPMCRVYRAIDEGIGRVLEAAGGDPLIMVCSDHGTQPISLRMQMPVWLKRYNYLTLNRPPSAVRLWRRAPGFVRKRVPVKTRSKVSKSLQLSGSRMNLAGSGLIDWSRTKAFVEPITAEALFLNVKGRESKGVVAPDAIEEFLEEMIERALDTEGPDGRQIIEGAIRQDQAYNGPRAEFGPDLVFKPTRNTMLGPALMGGARLFEIPEMPSPDDPPRPVGYHHPDGMVVIAGPGARPGARLAADASDITPTVLRYLGLPVPDDLDGSGIDDAFDDLAPATTVAHTAERTLGDELTAEEAADIEQHLQDLGYIE